MKKIFRIAKLELSILFYSPIAWLILIIFIVQTGLTYTDLLYSQETNQQLGRPLNVLSKVLFAGEDGILATIQRNLYLYIPLLTMGLFSRETHSGSIKLLLSSPVRMKEIVFGKYLSMMVYGFFLCLILSSFILTASFSIENLDTEFVIGGILGIYLLICAYASIGMFMSSITSYQVVAAISTLAVLALLNFIGHVGQQYDFIRDITYWISISGRADNMVNGLVSTKDILYFLLVTGLFIALTVFKLRDERKSFSTLIKVGRYSTLILAVIAIGYITSLPKLNFYYDTTRFKDRTLTKSSQELVNRIKDPVIINTYTNVIHYSARNGSPENRIEDLKHFEKYRRFLPTMKMNYISYYDTLPRYNDTTKTLVELAKSKASALKFDFEDLWTPEKIRKEKNLIEEDNRLVRFIHMGDKSTPLRMFDDIFQYPGESEISAAFKRMLDGPAKIGILASNGERDVNSMEDGSYYIITKGLNVRNSLLNQGFDIKEIKFSDSTYIPEGLDVLIIADPKKPYTRVELDAILKYIDEGNDVLIASEPGREDLINDILKNLGVEVGKGQLLQESENFEFDLIQSVFTPLAAKYGQSFYQDAIVTLEGASFLSYSDTTNFNIDPILITNPKKVWNKTEKFNLQEARVEFDSLHNRKIMAPVAIALTREINNKNQKIMVLGDADFMGNSEMNRRSPNSVNPSFTVRMFKWFTDGEYPVSSARPAAIDKVIKLSRSEILWVKAIYAAIIPLLIGGVGFFILKRRKRN